MYIKELKLKNFRNYEEMNVAFEKKFNIIYGDNAQGKTNILEAIFICSSGRSHRTSKDSEMIRLGEQFYSIKLNLEKENVDSNIEVSYIKDEKKKVRINEIPVQKLGNMMGHLNTVIFSPEDLLIIKEGPSERRRFIDITISQLRPSYFYDLQQYIKVLEQRNTLLKEIQYNKSLMDTLEIWSSNLAKIGARIIKVRNDFIKRLSEAAEKNHYRLTDNMERLCVGYNPSFDVRSFEALESIESDFSKKLEEIRSRELMKCTTLCGPQRDDYEIILDGKSTKQFGSQGQQRTSVLSIKLAEIEIMKEDTGEYPVLLLDDVMSELDHNRQEFLLRNLNEVQTFITCTDKSFFKERFCGESGYLRVKSGKIIERENC